MFHSWDKAAKLFIIVALVSTVACSELPELAGLMDNSSNDFTPSSYLVGEIASSLAAQVTSTAKPPASRIAPWWKSSDVPQQTSLFRSSRNLLELYSILRT